VWTLHIAMRAIYFCNIYHVSRLVASVWILPEAATGDINSRLTSPVILPYCKTLLGSLFPCTHPQTSCYVNSKHFTHCRGYAISRIEPATHSTWNNLTHEGDRNGVGSKQAVGSKFIWSVYFMFHTASGFSLLCHRTKLSHERRKIARS
jgi:hypothetical protein